MTKLVVAGALAAAAYTGGRHVGASERFTIAEVELRGAEQVSAGEVRARLGDLAGRHVFPASLARAEARIEAHPWVESARVRRDLPSRIRVDVREREPAAIAFLDRFYLVDERGLPFVRVRPGAEAARGLVVVTGLERRDYRRDPEGARERIREAIAAAEVYEAGDRPPLGEVHVGPEDRLSFVTYDDAAEIRTAASSADDIGAWLRGFDAAHASLSERERTTANLYRVEGVAAPERVTVDFSGRRARN